MTTTEEAQRHEAYRQRLLAEKDWTTEKTNHLRAAVRTDAWPSDYRQLALAELERRRQAGEVLPDLATLNEEDRVEALYERASRIQNRGSRKNNPILDNVVTGDTSEDDNPPLIRHGDFVVARDSVVVIYGLYAAGKTFLTIDLACTLATGLPWLGREDGDRNYPRGVLYVQTEGPQSQVANRIEAWRKAHPEASDPMEYLTHVRPHGFDWADDDVVTNIEEATRDDEITAGVVIFDTLDAGRPTGGNMNDEQVGRIFANVLPALAYKYDRSVFVVAHPNARDDSIAGLSRQANAAENIIHVKRRGDHRVAILEKTKDVAGRPEIPFQIVDSPHSSDSGPVGVVRVFDGPTSDTGRWLVDHLTKAGGADSSQSVKASAELAGISARQLRNAREEVAEIVRLGTGETVWTLRAEAS